MSKSALPRRSEASVCREIEQVLAMCPSIFVTRQVGLPGIGREGRQQPGIIDYHLWSLVLRIETAAAGYSVQVGHVTESGEVSGGMHYGILLEAKAPGKKLTAGQEATFRRARACGVICIVWDGTRDPSELLLWLRNMDGPPPGEWRDR